MLIIHSCMVTYWLMSDITEYSWIVSCRHRTSDSPDSHHSIVVCLSTPWGMNNKSEVDIHLAVLNDKRSSKSATSLSHSHSLTNWYTGFMHDDQ